MFGFFKKKEKFPDIDWFCDDCGDYLNSQSGFHDGCGEWTCTKCGQINPINEDEIIADDDFEDDSFGNDADHCASCGQSISRGSLTLPWEDGDNPYAYVSCPHCGYENFIELGEDD